MILSLSYALHLAMLCPLQGSLWLWPKVCVSGFFLHSFFSTHRLSPGWDLTGSEEHALHSGLSEMSSTCSFPGVHDILRRSCSDGFCTLSLSSTSISSLLFCEANPSTASLLDKHQLSSVGLGRAPSHSGVPLPFPHRSCLLIHSLT